jgi:hypothetical protein
MITDNDINNMKQIDMEPSTRTTKHGLIWLGFIITRVNTNKQLIDLSKTMNYLPKKWGKNRDFTSGK